MFFGARRYATSGNLFRTLLEIEVSRIQLKSVALLQDGVPVLVRQQDCNAMAVAAVAHLQNFRARLCRYALATVVNIQRLDDNCTIVLLQHEVVFGALLFLITF